jgi:hypothetical protein
MSMPELLALPVSFSLPTAARALAIGRNKAYEMAAEDGALTAEGFLPCPVRRYKHEYRVTRPDLFRAIGLPPDLVSMESLTPAQWDAMKETGDKLAGRPAAGKPAA